jgi:hypothetical protein
VKMCSSSVDWISVAIFCVKKSSKFQYHKTGEEKKNPNPNMPKAKQFLTIFDKHSHLKYVGIKIASNDTYEFQYGKFNEIWRIQSRTNLFMLLYSLKKS